MAARRWREFQANWMSTPWMAAGFALVIGAIGCGEETFDLLPPAEVVTGGQPPDSPTGGAAASGATAPSGGLPLGGYPTGGMPSETGGDEPLPQVGGTASALGGTGPGPDHQDPPRCPYCEPLGLICEPVSTLCVPLCTGDADCQGVPAGRFLCDADGLCVECLSNADCADPNRPLCVAWGFCAGCWDETVDCAEPTPYCEPWSNQCVECWDDYAHCAAPTPRCDRRKSQCVQCLNDYDCAPPTPRCDQGTGQCVQCQVPEDCAPGQYCDPTFQCVPPAQ